MLLLLPAMSWAGPVDIEDVGSWHAAQIADAKTGKRTIVQIPLVRRSPGWGCECPHWYIGDSPDMNGAGAWLKPSYSSTALGLLIKVGKGGQVVAEGYYTGKTEPFVWEANGKVRATYTMAGFHVLRWRMPRDGEAPEMQVLLSGPKAKEWVEPLRDDRPWLVIAHSLKLSSTGCVKGAEQRRKILISKGFKDAEVIDSRAAPMLSCCFKSVLVGRFKTRAEAKALKTAAKAKNVKTYVRQGW